MHNVFRDFTFFLPVESNAKGQPEEFVLQRQNIVLETDFFHPVRNLSEEKREIAAYVSKALSFVRKMQKFLATPQVPPLISADNTTETATSLLQWTGNAIDLVELIYGIDEMGCINNGNMPLKQLALRCQNCRRATADSRLAARDSS